MSSQSGVYVKDNDHGWLPANVLSYEGDNANVVVHIIPPSSQEEGGCQNTCSSEDAMKEERTVKLKDYDDGTLPLQNIDEGGNLLVVPDMCDLPSLHEVRNLIQSLSLCGW
jgi:hypothetical protein